MTEKWQDALPRSTHYLYAQLSYLVLQLQLLGEYTSCGEIQDEFSYHAFCQVPLWSGLHNVINL